MKKIFVWRNFYFVLVLLIMISCSVVPLSDRKRINFVPDGMMLNMSFSSYRDFLSQNPPLPASNSNTILVRNVGNRLSTSVTKFLKENNMGSEINNFAWEFNVVNNKEVNAWCMPGGKIVVYTGLFPITKDESGLAVVLSHEIAHAVAKHGNERMSQQLLVAFGGITLTAALEKKPEETKNLFLTVYGVSSTLGVLAYSRQHEYEADKLGLYFMAMAGYDPNKAIDFWQRMSANSTNVVPEILRTHPSDANRIAEMKKNLPQAMKYYKPN